jgi:ATP-binding cassette, subfamily B, bacterial PglK
MINRPSLHSLLNRLWRHISSIRRRQFALVFALTILCSFAEIVSLGAVVPFIGVITQPEIIFDYPFIAPFINFLGIENGSDLVMPLTIAFLIASMLSGGLRILLVWVSINTSNATGADLGLEIFRRTLYQPYHIHVSRSSSEVLSGMTLKIGSATGAVQTIMSIVTSGMLFTAIISTLFVINPIVAAGAIFIFGLAYMLIAFFARYRLSSNSDLIARKEILLVKIIQEGLGGIRDVLLDGTQSVYTEEYRDVVTSVFRSDAENKFLNIAPRFFMETLGIVLVIAIVIVMNYQSGNAVIALPMIAVFALGAQRSLPLMQQLYAGWTSLIGSKASMEDVLDLLDQEIPSYVNLPEPEPLNLNHSICFDNVSFRYSADTPIVLDGITLEVPKGARVGIIGTTGSGKSTALDLLMGMLKPTKGQILIDNQPISPGIQRAWQRTVAHVPQSIFLADKSITENIAFGVSPDKIDFNRVKKVAQQAQISEFIESRPEAYNAIVGEQGVRLSGGQRQRIGIARALYKKASVLIFDEATSALDNETEQLVMQAIEKLNEDITLFIIAHRITTLKNCTHIVELGNGAIKRVVSYQEIMKQVSR